MGYIPESFKQHYSLFLWIRSCYEGFKIIILDQCKSDAGVADMFLLMYFSFLFSLLFLFKNIHSIVSVESD